jgi:hypothetical protein
MRQAILEGACQGARGAINLAKISEVTRSLMSCLASSVTGYVMPTVGTPYLTLRPPRTNP